MWNMAQPLALSGVTRHIHKFFASPLKKGAVDLPYIYTGGLNCHWFKVVIALEIMAFLAERSAGGPSRSVCARPALFKLLYVTAH